MTDHDPIARAAARPDVRKRDMPAPVASLTRISIRHPARPGPDEDLEQVDNLSGASSFGTSSTAEVRLEATPADTAPASRRAFPTADARAPIAARCDPAPRSSDDECSVAPSAIIDLWEHLAADRLRPSISDVDPITIAGQWPNSLLLRVTELGRRPGLEVAHMFAPTAGGPTSAIPIDAMTVDWVVGLGREVVITEGPVHETDAVPTGCGPISCGVIALPFGPEAGVDHVLCHLYRVDERVLEGEIDAEISLPPRDRTGIKRLFGR